VLTKFLVRDDSSGTLVAHKEIKYGQLRAVARPSRTRNLGFIRLIS